MKQTKLNSFIKSTENKINKVLILDFHNILYRSLFASYGEYKKRLNERVMGETDEAEFTIKDMYNFWKHLMLSSFFYSCNDYKPNKIIIAFDGNGNWRNKIYGNYKGQRKAVRDKSKIDFDEAFQIFNKFKAEFIEKFSNVYFIDAQDSEADDIIAVLTKHLNKTNKIRLISTDNDFKQLLKYKNFEIFDPLNQKLKTSLNPDKDLEIKILTGDKSDNIPAIKPRTGVKTAEKMINNGLEVLEDKQIKENYIRNKKLIDFELIPDYIQQRIIDIYENYELKNVTINDIWTWLNKEKMNKLSEDFQNYKDLF